MIGHGIHLLKSLAYAIVRSIVSKSLKFAAIECISAGNSWVYARFPKAAREWDEFSSLVSAYMRSNNSGTNISSTSNDSKSLWTSLDEYLACLSKEYYSLMLKPLRKAISTSNECSFSFSQLSITVKCVSESLNTLNLVYRYLFCSLLLHFQL